MKKIRSSEGFTVIELMVGMVAFGVLALAVGSMLYFGWLGWRRSSDSVALQRNAMVAMRIIEHRIRNAASGEVDWNTGQMIFANDTDFAFSEINPGSVVVLHQPVNITSNAYGGINVEFTLETRNATYSKDFQMTIYPRN